MKIKRKNRKYSLPVQRAYLSREMCMREADRLLREGHVRNMTQRQVASEIYFHTSAYYLASFLERYRIHLRYIKQHADPIDITDGGDSLLRRFCFYTLWYISVFRK